MIAELSIAANLRALFQPGDTVELRCVGHRTINGYYRDLDRLAVDAQRLNNEFEPRENVFVGLNPIQPELYARRADEFGPTDRGGAVKDDQVTCRRWLLVDVDAVRPSGVSATNEQKQHAEQLAAKVHAWLSEQLGSECLVCADSGNGSHILVRLPDVAPDDEARWVCERFLALLADAFDTDEAKVDRTTFNAARITTCYGTTKRKGSNLAEQPHRTSRLVHVPDPLRPAEWSTICCLVGSYPGKHQSPPAVNGQPMLDIPLLLDERGVEFEHEDQYQTQSGERATRYVLTVCPFNADHTDRSAAIIHWHTNGAVAFKCYHNGCSGKDWRALQELWELPSEPQGITVDDIVFSKVTTSQTSQNSLESYFDPPVVDSTAFYGPLGAIARRLEERTEASPIAILCGTLNYFGNAMGRRYHLKLDQPHFPKLYIAFVGPTATGRKGTADSQSQQIVDAIDPLWAEFRHGGLSTGEGILEVLQEYSEGVVPHPALFNEREFAAVLKLRRKAWQHA